MKRAAGVLLHPTSLPGPHGVGSLGDEAERFLDWLERAGVGIWQILPLVPPGAGDSPYSSGSAFAGSPWLLDLPRLAADGWLDDADLAGGPRAGDRVDFTAMKAFKGPLLRKAAERLVEEDPGRLDAFRAANPWVEDAALFYAARRQQKGLPWWEWPAALRDREVLDGLPGVEAEIALQCLFDEQWGRIHEAARERGVEVLGDLPIYVDWDSADVWAHRELFDLDETWRPTEVSGVPPDAFSDTGQLWGNPLYRWDVLASRGYDWWVERLRRVLSVSDRVRIDHFRAFAAYWAVPAGADDARGGRWVEGPGVAVFDAFRAALGELPILAEDLGIIDQPVRDLLEATGLPGMRVLQFAFGGEAEDLHLPHNHPPNAVAYTGTHDNDTTLGWWLSATPHVRDHVRRYFGIDGHDLVWDLVRACLASVAHTAVVPMQDVLALGAEGRMNRPATAGGNWGWRLLAHQLRDDHATRLRGLIELYGRA